MLKAQKGRAYSRAYACAKPPSYDIKIDSDCFHNHVIFSSFLFWKPWLFQSPYVKDPGPNVGESTVLGVITLIPPQG